MWWHRLFRRRTYEDDLEKELRFHLAPPLLADRDPKTGHLQKRVYGKWMLTAFGSLALSGHPGTASMGELLLISLGCTLVASLVFIPALLATVPRPDRQAERSPSAGALRSRG